MENNTIDTFDFESFFHDEVEKYWKEIKRICTVHHIPCYFSACVKNDSSGSEYYSDGVMTGSNDIHLKEDLITKHLLLNNGFDVVPHYDDSIEDEIDINDIDEDDTYEWLFGKRI